MKKVVPIVFASDNNYALYLYVTLYSLIKNSSDKNEYRIFVFYTDLNEKNQEFLKGLSKENVIIECIDVSQYASDIHMDQSNHITIETTYRLLIPVVLKEYEKVIYLDTDIVILNDIAHILDYDIGEFPLAAAPDVKTIYMRTHYKNIGYTGSKYLNSGVMIINNAVFEKMEIRNKCLTLLEEDYNRDKRRFKYPDQDTLALVVPEDYAVLDLKWNFQWHNMLLEERAIEEPEKFKEAMSNPYIVHYTSEKKAWNYPDMKFASYFWDFAIESGICLQIVEKQVVKLRKELDETITVSTVKFPFDHVKHKEKIALYGAGMNGRKINKMLAATEYAKVVMWVDKNASRVSQKGIEDIDYLVANENKVTKIVVTIQNVSIVDEVIQELVRRGISIEKIIWSEYEEQ